MRSYPILNQLTLSGNKGAKENSHKQAKEDFTFEEGQVISDLTQLKRLPSGIESVLVEMVGRRTAVFACPVKLKNQQILVFYTPDHKDSPLLSRVTDLVKEEQKIATGVEVEPQLVCVEATLMLTLVQEGQGKVDNIAFKAMTDLDMAFQTIIEFAVEQNASDIHFNINNDQPHSQIHATIDGHYVAPPRWLLPTPHLKKILNIAWQRTKGGRGVIFDEQKESQGQIWQSVKGNPCLLRLGSFIADTGPSVTLRIQHMTGEFSHQSFESMGYLPCQAEMLARAQVSLGGAIVLGGVPSSGKTTSISNLLSTLPSTRKIMTIEDPVERLLPNAIQATIGRGDGSEDENPFFSKLQMLKRSAATDIFLGEIRDQATGQSFQDIVETGNNLYSTTHTVSCLAIPERLMSRQIGVPLELLSMPGMLKLVGYQALLPVLCKCALPYSELFKGGVNSIGQEVDGEKWKRYFDLISSLYDIDISTVQVRNPKGCAICNKQGLPELYGYKGRTIVAELFELAQYKDALRAIQKRDVLELHQFYSSLKTSPYDSPDMAGKTAMDAAVYKMLQGILDPRDIEPRFTSFQTIKEARKGR